MVKAERGQSTFLDGLGLVGLALGLNRIVISLLGHFGASFVMALVPSMPRIFS